MFILEAEKIVNRKTICIDNAYLDKDRIYLPDYAGIYFVFTGKVENQPEGGFRMKSPTLLYIGMAKDINDRHNNEDGTPKHEHYPDFVKMKGAGEQIAYAFCPISEFADRYLIESALIYQFQPPINIQKKYTFHHRKTRLAIESKIEFPYVGQYEIEQA